MRKFIKHILLSIAGGTIAQLLIFSLAVLINSPVLVLVLLLPGWVVGFAGRDSDVSISGQAAGWLLMLGINDLIYGPLIFLVSWQMAKRKELEEIRSLDYDTYVKRLNDGSLQIK
jgi:hypothetical protein